MWKFLRELAAIVVFEFAGLFASLLGIIAILAFVAAAYASFLHFGNRLPTLVNLFVSFSIGIVAGIVPGLLAVKISKFVGDDKE